MKQFMENQYLSIYMNDNKMMKLNYNLMTIIMMCILIISCSDNSTTPNEKTFRYGENLGKITFWTTWDQVNSNSIKIDIYDSNSNFVDSGFLSQHYNFGNKPDCDENIYGATSPKILKVGKYSYVGSTKNGYKWNGTFEIKEDYCLLWLLYVN